MKYRNDFSVQHQKGFTILELMVATSTFAIVLMVLTAGVLAFSSDYFKSITESNTQSVARSVINDVAQNVQFGSTYSPLGTSGNSTSFCIDNVQYTYAIGYEVTSAPNPANHQSKYGLIKQTGPNCNGAVLNDVTDSSYVLSNNPALVDNELLGDHMRLAGLDIKDLGNSTWSIHVRIIYGDDNLLSPAVKAGPNDWSKEGCATTTGAQFCAVSDLTTVVQQRYTSN